jgi:hypothetical protein
LAASFISNQARDVAYWHLTDKSVLPIFVRFRTIADKGQFQLRIGCPLMTQSGHPRDLLTVGLAGLIPAIQITLIS